MAAGLTRNEQWALLGVIMLILLGLLWQNLGPNPFDDDEIYVEGQGRWRKLADFEVPAAEAPLASGGIPTDTSPANGLPGGAFSSGVPHATGDPKEMSPSRAGPGAGSILPGALPIESAP